MDSIEAWVLRPLSSLPASPHIPHYFEVSVYSSHPHFNTEYACP